MAEYERSRTMPAQPEHVTDADPSALLRSRPDQMRLEWGTRDDGSYAGWLQVAGIDSGASEVTLHLSFLDKRHDPGEALVGEALDSSLARGTGADMRRQRGGLTAPGPRLVSSRRPLGT